MTGPARVCHGCGTVFAGHDDLCTRCQRARREMRLIESGYRRGWADALRRVGAALDHRALARALEDLRAGGEG